MFKFNKTISKPPKVALFLGHLGLGDQIWLNGAVRYIAQFYERVELVCMVHNFKTVSMMYSDIPSIQIVTVEEGYNVFPTAERKGSCFPFKRENYEGIYECGYYKNSTSEFDGNAIPDSFYDDLKLHRSVRHTFFKIPELTESKSLYENVKNISYAFVQTRSSSATTPIISWNINNILTIDPNINHYAPDHPWYGIADLFINKPFLWYSDTILRAKELHMVNSSFYSLASQLKPLDAIVTNCYNRDTAKIMQEYDYH